MPIRTLQIGKQKITPNFLETLRKQFEKKQERHDIQSDILFDYRNNCVSDTFVHYPKNHEHGLEIDS